VSRTKKNLATLWGTPTCDESCSWPVHNYIKNWSETKVNVDVCEHKSEHRRLRAQRWAPWTPRQAIAFINFSEVVNFISFYPKGLSDTAPRRFLQQAGSNIYILLWLLGITIITSPTFSQEKHTILFAIFLHLWPHANNKILSLMCLPRPTLLTYQYWYILWSFGTFFPFW
jgi:hypothetical protein